MSKPGRVNKYGNPCNIDETLALQTLSAATAKHYNGARGQVEVGLHFPTTSKYLLESCHCYYGLGDE